MKYLMLSIVLLVVSVVAVHFTEKRLIADGAFINRCWLALAATYCTLAALIFIVAVCNLFMGVE